MPRNPVGWFEIYVQDMARARAFYEEVLQVQLERLGGLELEMWMFSGAMEAGGCTGALVHMPRKSSGTGGTLIYFSCADCALEEARVVSHGGQVRRSKMSIGEHGFISLVEDTEGNMIGLHSQE